MKFACLQSHLSKAITLAAFATEAGTIQPSLGFILIEAGDGEVTVTGAGYNSTIISTLEADVSSFGSFAVPAQTVTGLVKSFSSGDEIKVELNKAASRLKITSNTFKANLTGMLGNDWTASKFDPHVTSVVDPFLFSRSVQSVGASAADNRLGKSMPSLMGIQIEPYGENRLAFISTDGFRAGMASIPYSGTIDKPGIVAVPMLTVIANQLEDDMPLTMGFDDSKAYFTFGQTQIKTSMYTTPLPDVRKRLANCETMGTFTVSVAEILESLGNVLSIIKGHENRILARFAEDHVSIEATTDKGDAVASIGGELDGAPGEVWLSGALFNDAIRSVRSPNVLIGIPSDVNTPVIFKPEDGFDFNHYVMQISGKN